MPRLEAQLGETLAFLARIPEERSLHRYAPDKWSIRQVLGHVNDAERLFMFRAFWFARGLDAPLPSSTRRSTTVARRSFPLGGHVRDFRAARLATLSFFRTLPAEAWMATGVASDNPFHGARAGLHPGRAPSPTTVVCSRTVSVVTMEVRHEESLLLCLALRVRRRARLGLDPPGRGHWWGPEAGRREVHYSPGPRPRARLLRFEATADGIRLVSEGVSVRQADGRFIPRRVGRQGRPLDRQPERRHGLAPADRRQHYENVWRRREGAITSRASCPRHERP